MPSPERITWTPLLIMQTLPSFWTPWLSMPSTSPYPATFNPSLSLTPLFSKSSQPWMWDPLCSLVPPFRIGCLTMVIFTFTSGCMFLPLPAQPSSIQSTLPPSWATWGSSTLSQSLNKTSGSWVFPLLSNISLLVVLVASRTRSTLILLLPPSVQSCPPSLSPSNSFWLISSLISSFLWI